MLLLGLVQVEPGLEGGREGGEVGRGGEGELGHVQERKRRMSVAFTADLLLPE